MLVGATAVADASDIGVVVPIAVALWAALAAYAWGHGRLALFVTIVPVYYGLAFGVAYQLEAPCGLREISPAIDQREEVVKWWPPHTVCELRMADGSREYDGGFPLTLLSPFLWACAASALALVPRPHVGLRGGLIVVTWFAAVVLSFI